MVTLLATARIRREVQFQSGTVCFVKVSSRGVFREENVNHCPRTVACFNQRELRINQNFAPVRFQRGPSTKLATAWITPNVLFQPRRTVCFTHLSSYERFFVRTKKKKSHPSLLEDSMERVNQGELIPSPKYVSTRSFMRTKSTTA